MAFLAGPAGPCMVHGIGACAMHSVMHGWCVSDRSLVKACVYETQATDDSNTT